MTEPAAAPPRADNWAEDHRRKGTQLKKGTRQTADEARAQPNEAFCSYYRSQLGPLLQQLSTEAPALLTLVQAHQVLALAAPPSPSSAHTPSVGGHVERGPLRASRE